MHIPDGYLSPQTYVPAYGVMIPLWWRATVVLKRTLRNRQVPILALGAAFSFVIMMFNVPIPGGTTGHAVGGVLVAILLGPWAAMVAVTLALVVQALMFGDGGVTTFGANCLNMAVLMPFVGWWTYRLVAGRRSVSPRRQWIAAAVGGYVGLNAAALGTAIMFGIQPLIAHDAAGRALYCPFGLKLALAGVSGTHVTLFGFVEAAVTGLVVAYLRRVEPGLLPGVSEVATKRRRLSPVTRLGVVVGALVVLTPLGLYLPAKLGAGSAWGEWSSAEITKLVGYTPSGLGHAESIWKAPAPDYSLPGSESAPLGTQGALYVFAGVVGIVVLMLAAFVLKKTIWRRRVEADSPVDATADRA